MTQALNPRWFRPSATQLNQTCHRADLPNQRFLLPRLIERGEVLLGRGVFAAGDTARENITLDPQNIRHVVHVMAPPILPR